MPAIETSDLYQRAVIWGRTGYNGHGEPVVGAPTEVQARWVTKQSLVPSKDDNNIGLDGTVIVGVAVAIGSVLWQGTLAQWYGTGSASQDTGLYEVVSYDQTPDLKNRFQRQTLGVKRLKQTLPS